MMHLDLTILNSNITRDQLTDALDSHSRRLWTIADRARCCDIGDAEYADYLDRTVARKLKK